MSKRLLLADDSVTIQKVIGITFANEDYQLDIVDNGDAALEHARAQRPDLVLADVYMPGRNGYELCAAIKQDADLARVPVMLLTGTFEPFDEDKARQAGADAWISKPFESQQLIDQVEELLARVESAPVAAPFATPEDVEPVPAAEAAESWADVAVEEDDLFDLADEELSADTTDDDIWGSVAMEEDDLLGDVESDEPDGAFFTEPEPSVEMGAITEATAEADVWSELDDEIFDLEDDDIIDEADLLEDVAQVTAAPATEPTADLLAEEDLLEVEEPVESPAAAGWSIPGVELPEFGMDVEPVAEVEPESLIDAEPEPLTDLAPESSFDVEPEEVFELDAEALLDAEPEAEPAAEQVFEQPVAEAAVATESAARAVSLDAAQVDRIVERVAREVVERLAESLLERVAWEVVPDLAESLIKDEIRKIKANLR